MTNYSKAQTLHYLALGDSYTIGESVSEKDRFPSQLVSILKNSGSFRPGEFINWRE